ncbi:hypothetical protein CRX67_03875 [Enterobacteriaceae bacterium A-F18]|nr:hypothetical protein CRX67_03875 [Enterobacteriaceae bacterium A-F18]
MNNRKASRLLGVSVKDGGVRTIRISNRRVLIIWPNGTIVGAQKRKPSAAQNRWKNHCYRVESKGAQS